MRRLKKLDLQLMSELIKNCRRSDRDLARAVGSSQPTITRKRARLEKEGLIESYTGIPSFVKLGFEIMAFSFYAWRSEANLEALKHEEANAEKLSAFLSKNKNIIFTSKGRGFGMERMMISVHTSYADYVRLMKAVSKEWGDRLSQTNSFIVSLQEDAVGTKLNFEHFADHLSKAL